MSMIKTAGLQAYTLLAVQGAVWGSSFQAIKYALEGFGPISIAAGRILIAALVLLAYALMQGDRLPRSASSMDELFADWFVQLCPALFPHPLGGAIVRLR